VGSSAKVTSAETYWYIEPNSIAVHATNQGEIFVAGNVTGVAYAALAENGGKISVGGNADGSVIGPCAKNGGIITVTGDVAAGTRGIYATGQDSMITVRHISAVTYGAYVEDKAKALILGICSQESQDGIGVFVNSRGEVTVEDAINEKGTYAKINGETKNGTLLDRTEPTTKEGYHTYSTANSADGVVWVKSGAVQPYTLTVQGGTGSGNYGAGMWVSIVAEGAPAGKVFDRWTSSGGGILADASSPNTSFNMPAQSVTLTANWKNSGSGNDGGSSVGGVPAPGTVILEARPNQPLAASVSLAATLGRNGSAGAVISDRMISDAIEKVQGEDKLLEKTTNGISVGLDVAMPQGASSLTATLTQNSLNDLVKAGVNSLELSGAPVSLGLDLKALQEIQSQSGGTLSIRIAPVAGLSGEAKSLIGERPVYSITINTVKDGKEMGITGLGNGRATLSIPYTPGVGESVGCLFGVYVDENGKPVRIDGSFYDAKARAILVPTGHFSLYGVGYTAASEKFTDINGHWGKEAIDYVTGQGLFSGVTDTRFGPDAVMTRGMLVTVLGRLAGADMDQYKGNNFLDVKSDSPFRPYIEWAFEQGITQGIGARQFAPDRAVTREEIALLFANYAKVTGYDLPVVLEATAYGDAGNRFAPQSNATRAEISSMLYRYIKRMTAPFSGQN